MIERLATFFVEHAPQIALLGFFIGFLLILGMVMRPSNKTEMDEHARIPLKESE